MKLNGKIIAGAVILLLAAYWWLAARSSYPPSLLYVFTFRLFPFADVLWTIAGAVLLYRGVEESREA